MILRDQLRRPSGRSTDELDFVVEQVLQSARIPGAALAVVNGDEVMFARGYGYCDLKSGRPVTAQSVYPIASTTKAMNATLLAMLVGERLLMWDEPIQSYVPDFRMHDEIAGRFMTLRDLVLMRAGLPRHDWMWIDHPIGRSELVDRARYLIPSAGFRDRFQYNNLTPTIAGHIAERMAGQSWEQLISQRLLQPLGMKNTTFNAPVHANATLSYHENKFREIVETKRFESSAISPAGGSIYSTVEDMAQWICFNLNHGRVLGRSIINESALVGVYKPQILPGTDPSAPTGAAIYALGWFVDSYNGCKRVSHGGYLHDVNSEVMFFPDERLGIVSFTNFGPPRLARFIGQCAFDWFYRHPHSQSLSDLLNSYERKIGENARRILATPRVLGARHTHALECYVGTYAHPAYGRVTIGESCGQLFLQRHELCLPLEHWHYDSWVAAENDLFQIHLPHAFDRSSRIRFETDCDGGIDSVHVGLEPTVGSICFRKSV